MNAESVRDVSRTTRGEVAESVQTTEPLAVLIAQTRRDAAASDPKNS